MKTTIAISLLGGALLASAGLNVQHLRQSAPAGEPLSGGCATGEAASQPTCRMVEQLGLTKGQCQKIFGCRGGECALRRGEVSRCLRARIADLQRELNAKQIDRQRINELADEIVELRAQEWKDRIQCILQVRETLTPEQLERLAAIVEGP